MRSWLIFGLLVLAGCATVPTQPSMEWNLSMFPEGGSSPVVKGGQLVLHGQAIRSANVYSAPFTLECELQPGQSATNNTFYVDFVPEDEPLGEFPKDRVAFQLIHNQTVQLSVTRGTQATQLLKPETIHADTNGWYELAITARPDGIDVRVNGQMTTVDYPMPYPRLRIELRAFPPPSPWRVSNFSIH